MTLGEMSSSRLSSASVFSPVRIRWTAVRVNSVLKTRLPSAFRRCSPMGPPAASYVPRVSSRNGEHSTSRSHNRIAHARPTRPTLAFNLRLLDSVPAIRTRCPLRRIRVVLARMLVLILGLALAPAQGQQARVPSVGYLGNSSASLETDLLEAFRRGL